MNCEETIKALAEVAGELDLAKRILKVRESIQQRIASLEQSAQLLKGNKSHPEVVRSNLAQADGLRHALTYMEMEGLI